MLNLTDNIQSSIDNIEKHSTFIGYKSGNKNIFLKENDLQHIILVWGILKESDKQLASIKILD